MAYGSNLNLEQMAYRCPTAKVVSAETLYDYQLEFRRVATIVKRKGSCVPVGIWEIDDECEKSLDRYEGYPTLYRKEYIKMMVKGEEKEVMVYIMNRGFLQMPSDSYLFTIWQGYQDVGLDLDKLEDALNYTKTRIADEWL